MRFVSADRFDRIIGLRSRPTPSNPSALRGFVTFVDAARGFTFFPSVSSVSSVVESLLTSSN